MLAVMGTGADRFACCHPEISPEKVTVAKTSGGIRAQSVSIGKSYLVLLAC